MKMAEVKEKAKALGMDPGKMKQADLIREIQSTEGNFPCFQTGLVSCDQFLCCWRGDCMPEESPKMKKAPVKKTAKKAAPKKKTTKKAAPAKKA
ncbi:MAG: hypothetical protein KAJ60_11390, partial [Desulfobulbaceae bacterium]|nr:hypothetical protein [Desulfobulbaceae bacterium]